jgi:hypothetical protein
MNVGWGGFDREENGTSSGTSLSPGATKPTCGEVYTFSFGYASSVLQAKVSNVVLTGVPGTAGWAQVTLNNGGLPLPSVGFAATSLNFTGVNMGYTIPHRWN